MHLLLLTALALGEVGTGATLAGSASQERGLLLAQSDRPMQRSLAADPYAGWTREQLIREYDHLDSVKPGLAAPIVLMSVGGVVVVNALSFLLVGLGGFGTGGIAVAAVVLAVVGGGLLIAGLVLLPIRLMQRQVFNDKQTAIQNRLDALPEYREPPVQGPAPGVPPPQVRGFDVDSPVLLASF